MKRQIRLPILGKFLLASLLLIAFAMGVGGPVTMQLSRSRQRMAR